MALKLTAKENSRLKHKMFGISKKRKYPVSYQAREIAKRKIEKKINRLFLKQLRKLGVVIGKGKLHSRNINLSQAFDPYDPSDKDEPMALPGYFPNYFNLSSN